MTEYIMVYQPVSTTMANTTQFATSYMFVTTLEEHLYGGLSIVPSYPSLYGTFSSATSSPWTSPMKSKFGIPYRTYLRSATESTPLPPSIPTFQQQTGPYVGRH